MRACVPIVKHYETNAKNCRTKIFFFFFTVTGCARVKLQQQGIYQTITLIDDLKYLFLGECFTLC